MSSFNDIGSPEWYVMQFGTQKSYREMLFGPLDEDDEMQRRIDEHEVFLASEGADHLFEGHGE